ncbi:hypothetical protein ABHA69_01550, partial [Ligilactobacillus ruminis]
MKILAKKFTNKVPIFINADDFAKCSTCSIRAPRRPYGQNADSWDLPVKSGLRLFLLISIMADDCHAYAKTGLDLQS